jgi:CBS domain containing-hemolysin-like protein
MLVFTPFVAFFVLWKKMLKKLFRLDSNDAITGDELINIVQEAEEGGGLDEGESDLIKSAISFSECTAGDVLTPRVDIVAVDKGDSVEEITKAFDESGFSRLPVYDETVDSIIGFIHNRDFNKYVVSAGQTVESIVKDTVFVAKQMPVSELLKLLQSKKTHMAVIADEYGGTIGIVTMEDILEELVGEIWDEYDEVVEEFVEQEDGTVTVLCSAQLEKMFEYFGLDLDEESESVSVGGWVLEQLGKIAEEGTPEEIFGAPKCERLKTFLAKVL